MGIFLKKHTNIHEKVDITDKLDKFFLLRFICRMKKIMLDIEDFSKN
jgi:hypothetical protein